MLFLPLTKKMLYTNILVDGEKLSFLLSFFQYPHNICRDISFKQRVPLHTEGSYKQEAFQMANAPAGNISKRF